ncbi:MAG: PQQ-like beta-propeller repeat protein [Cyclobacteriaceae bacterium]|nr:PQQ-like beta-propeller repeat protein [Cyclobacteriaceae bacterium]
MKTIQLLKSAFICSGVVILLSSCSPKESKLAWEKKLYAIGSQSSPRTRDLNQDGILDIVMGAARSENQYTEQGILAINGKTGDLLWQQEANDQVVGSATFYDITNDGVDDVFIGGRSPNLKALDGTNGDVLWEYKYTFENDSILKHARFNFYNSVLVPDQDQDGYPELLVVNGGNVKAAPHSEINRFPGVLMMLNSKTGQIMAADTMPDGKESYMSPLCFSQPGSNELNIVFGTGGETISGNLYLARLSDLLDGKLSKAIVIATQNGHGFIAPPVLADISEDGRYDIIAISHGSTVFAIDGNDRQLLWKRSIDNTESSNSFAVGYFTSDNIPDFFTFVSEGQWPNSTRAFQVMLNGKNGQIAYLDSMGCVGFSSPVVYDLNRDGIDEAIFSLHDYDCKRKYTDPGKLDVKVELMAIDFSNHSVNSIDRLKGFKNAFSTPWIGDLDNDGYLDIIHCQYYSPNSDLLSFLGMNVKRIDTHFRAKKPPLWGAYMGSNGDGLFPIQQ